MFNVTKLFEFALTLWRQPYFTTHSAKLGCNTPQINIGGNNFLLICSTN